MVRTLREVAMEETVTGPGLPARALELVDEIAYLRRRTLVLERELRLEMGQDADTGAEAPPAKDVVGASTALALEPTVAIRMEHAFRANPGKPLSVAEAMHVARVAEEQKVAAQSAVKRLRRRGIIQNAARGRFLLITVRPNKAVTK